MKINLGIFFGGESVEHEVSVITAIQAINAINKEKYSIIPIYISKNGEMYYGEGIDKIESYTDIPALLKNSIRVVLIKQNNKVLVVRYPAKKFSNNEISSIDVAFPMGHGTNVEDGVFQGYLQLHGIPYVGCDVLSAAIGMNKYAAKLMLQHEGIPVLDGVRVGFHEYTSNADTVIANLEQTLKYPMIVKPINLGSSVGIKIGRDEETLAEAFDHAFLFADELLIEPAVTNLKEVNVSVLGDASKAEASECEEPISSAADDGILSYGDKYTAGAKNSGMASLSRKIPADISAEQREKIRSIAVNAFRALGCNGVARIDFLINLDDNQIYLNEINTVPGSLSFYLWEPVGLKYSDLLDKMISLALKRDRQRKNLNFSFETNILKTAKLGGAKGSKI